MRPGADLGPGRPLPQEKPDHTRFSRDVGTATLPDVTATSAIAKRDRKTRGSTIKLLARLNMDAAAMDRLLSIIGSAPIDKTPTRREHSGEAMLGPFGSIPE